MKKGLIAFTGLFFCSFLASYSIAAENNSNAKNDNGRSNMNIKIGNEYVGMDFLESKYLAYAKTQEAKKTLQRLKQSTSTYEFSKKTTKEQREGIAKMISELEREFTAIDDERVTEKEFVKLNVKLQDLINEIEMIDNVSDYTYGFAPKFMIKTGMFASGKYVFFTPFVINFNLYYQLNSAINPFFGLNATVPILLTNRADQLANGNGVSTYAFLIEGRFGNLFKLNKSHYVALFFKIGGLIGHQSEDKDTRVEIDDRYVRTEKTRVIARTNPLGEGVETGVGLEYFFKNKLVVGASFDIYNATGDSPVKKRTNFGFGINIGYNFCSGNKSTFSTDSRGRTSVYKTIWE